jgi:hypothetical protein
MAAAVGWWRRWLRRRRRWCGGGGGWVGGWGWRALQVPPKSVASRIVYGGVAAVAVFKPDDCGVEGGPVIREGRRAKTELVLVLSDSAVVTVIAIVVDVSWGAHGHQPVLCRHTPQQLGVDTERPILGAFLVVVGGCSLQHSLFEAHGQALAGGYLTQGAFYSYGRWQECVLFKAHRLVVSGGCPTQGALSSAGPHPTMCSLGTRALFSSTDDLHTLLHSQLGLASFGRSPFCSGFSRLVCHAFPTPLFKGVTRSALTLGRSLAVCFCTHVLPPALSPLSPFRRRRGRSDSWQWRTCRWRHRSQAGSGSEAAATSLPPTWQLTPNHDVLQLLPSTRGSTSLQWMLPTLAPASRGVPH